MALMLLRVFLLGVVAAAADDVPVTWWSTPRASLPCSPPSPERLQLRRPPPPLDADDHPRVKTYQWKKDGEDVNSKRISQSGVLEVSRRREGEGVYQCLVRHHGGLVLGYPTHLKFASMEKQFSVHPADGTAKVGQPFLLGCSISSAPPASISWLRDDVPLYDSDKYYLLQNQLLIMDVTTEDAGYYRCIATNPYVNKTRSSEVGKLQVDGYDDGEPPAFLPVTLDRSITAPRGSRVVLPCPVTGWPTPKLNWEMTVGNTKSELEVVDQVFVIQSLEPEYEGTYTCTVEGHRHLTKTFNVTLTEPVSITIPPVSKETHRASTVRFTCTATGQPAPTITWYKDGQLLNIAGRINMRVSADKKRIELVISGVTSSDAGVYQCFAQNLASTASEWAVLNVTGADAAAPTNVQCWPVGHNQVKVTWQKPSVGTFVAYTIHATPEENKSVVSGTPEITTDVTVTVNKPLAPYRFQVRAYGSVKDVVSDYSVGAICQGQGVPIKLMKLEDESVLVSWKKFAEDNPEIAQWILQYKIEDSSRIYNVTLDASVHNYTLAAEPAWPSKVRVLGSRNTTWLHQDLSLVPWTSTDVAPEMDSGDITAIPQDIEITRLESREMTITWRCDNDAKYTFMVCIRSNIVDKCQQTEVPTATFDSLEPDTEYEIRVQARLEPRALGGPFSAPFSIATLPDNPPRFKELTGYFINSSTLNVSWNGAPSGRYTVHYSSKLKLPVNQWDSVETMSNSVLIPGIDPRKTTFLMVTGYHPDVNSKITTIEPKVKDPNANDLKYELTSTGVRVWWQGVDPRVVKYSQNITRPMSKWSSIVVNEPSVELTNLDPSLPIFVTVSNHLHNQVLTIDPRTKEPSSLYLEIGIPLGVLCAAIVLAVIAVCIWRRHKRLRSPGRSRRRNSAANEETPEEAEMKSLAARGGRARGAGEPLLNGRPHHQSKTPNGKMKKGRYEPAFDVSRSEPASRDTAVDADTSADTMYTLLDTSRKELDLSRTSRDLPANDSFVKLPDDNMNSELTRSTFQLDNSNIQPTLQPNG